MNNKNKVKKRRRTVRLLVLCLLAIALATWAVSCNVRKTRLKTTFAKIQIGDTKQNVVQALGQPSEIATCREPASNVNRSQTCVETYWYKSFLVRWGYAFNDEGKVVDKIHNVSY